MRLKFKTDIFIIFHATEIILARTEGQAIRKYSTQLVFLLPFHDSVLPFRETKDAVNTVLIPRVVFKIQGILEIVAFWNSLVSVLSFN